MIRRRLALLVLVAVPATIALVMTTAASSAIAASRFTRPIALPQSADFGEPSITADLSGVLYVTAPRALLNVTGGGSPVWISTNGGRSFGDPIAPAMDPVAGGDTDVVTDAAGNVYQTDLWLGNSAMAVSTDHGQNWVANEWGHVMPGDDRPWLAYSPSDLNLYLTWDGLDGIHVGRTNVGPPAGSNGGLAFPQDIIAVPECVLGGDNPCSTPPIRQCVCPPGGIAVDPKTGEVYVSFSRQNGGTNGGGVGISYSTDQGVTWTQSYVPGTGTTGSAFDTEWNFDPIRVDQAGNVYVAWGEHDPVSGGVAIRFSASADHGLTWSKPVTISKTTGTNVFPTLDVVKPGVVDIAYYGAAAKGDPNKVDATWNLYFAQVTNALTRPTFSPVVAAAGIHTGCIQAGGGAECSDRSLLDFFQLVVFAGKANIIYTAGDATHGTQLYFVKQTA